MMRVMKGAWLCGFLAVACSDEHAAQGPSGAADSGTSAADSGTGPVEPASYNTCSVDADCAWGEIDHEILRAKDCTCLFGCPYLPLSKATVQRRSKQYDTLCDPRRSGNGDPCGIDDCAAPPTVVCRAGVCAAADAGAGR